MPPFARPFEGAGRCRSPRTLRPARAMGSFGRAGWRVTADPVDYLTAGPGRWRPGFSLMHGLSLLTVAEKEWIGLAAYRLFGWTDRLFPGGDV